MKYFRLHASTNLCYWVLIPQDCFLLGTASSPPPLRSSRRDTWTEGELSHLCSSHCLVHLSLAHLWRRSASDESDVSILLAAISQTEELREEEALPMLPAQGRSLVPPTNFAGYGVVEVARLSKTFPFQARAPAQPSAPLSRGPRLSAPLLRGPAIPSLHPPHSLLTIRPEPPRHSFSRPNPDPLTRFH